MMQTLPWWSLEGSACGHVEYATLLPEAFLVAPQKEEGLSSKCPRSNDFLGHFLAEE